MSVIDHVVTVHEAKSQLSRLIAEVESGRTVGIARGKGEPTVMLTRAVKPRRTIGWMSGTKVPADFDSMGSNEITEMFEGIGN